MLWDSGRAYTSSSGRGLMIPSKDRRCGIELGRILAPFCVLLG